MTKATSGMCKWGHDITGKNRYVAPKTKLVGCKVCRALSSKKARSTSNDKTLFGGNREKAIQRDGEKCIKCGMTRQDHKLLFNRDITVDHIDNNGVSKPKHLKNNDLTNLMTLCIQCHSVKDNRVRKLTAMQIVNIFHIGYSLKEAEIARLYGVSKSNIGYIRRGELGKKSIELLKVGTYV